MTADQLALLELLLVFGGVLGVAIWQLVAVKRSIQRDRDAEAARRETARDETARAP